MNVRNPDITGPCRHLKTGARIRAQHEHIKNLTTHPALTGEGGKLFICLGGERSKEIAAFLRDWLRNVHQNIEPFMSEEDIGKGERWSKVLTDKLEDSDFGLVCLTSENLTAPWLHFEAGALSKIAGSHLVPILYKVQTEDINGPLKDFQAASLDNKAQMRHVLTQINDVMADQGNSNWPGTFEVLWGEVEKKVKSLDELDKIQIT